MKKLLNIILFLCFGSGLFAQNFITGDILTARDEFYIRDTTLQNKIYNEIVNFRDTLTTGSGTLPNPLPSLTVGSGADSTRIDSNGINTNNKIIIRKYDIAVGNNNFVNKTRDGSDSENSTAFGHNTLEDAVNASAINNAFGGSALRNTTTGNGNNAFGSYALGTNIIGNYNSAFGSQSLENTTGSNNIGIGNISGLYNGNRSNRLYINSLNRTNILGDTTNSIIYGNQNSNTNFQHIYLNSQTHIKENLYLSDGKQWNQGVTHYPDSVSVAGFNPDSGMVWVELGYLDTLNLHVASVTTTGKITASGDLTYDTRHAFLTRDATYVPTITQNVFFKLAPVFTTIEASNVTSDGDTLTIITSGDYLITWTFEISGANGDDYTMQIRKNALPQKTSRQTTTGANNYNTVTMLWYFEGLITGDDISFYCTNTANSNDPTFTFQSIYLRKEHD